MSDLFTIFYLTISLPDARPFDAVFCDFTHDSTELIKFSVKITSHRSSDVLFCSRQQLRCGSTRALRASPIGSVRTFNKISYNPVSHLTDPAATGPVVIGLIQLTLFFGVAIASIFKHFVKCLKGLHIWKFYSISGFVFNVINFKSQK